MYLFVLGWERALCFPRQFICTCMLRFSAMSLPGYIYFPVPPSQEVLAWSLALCCERVHGLSTTVPVMEHRKYVKREMRFGGLGKWRMKHLNLPEFDDDNHRWLRVGIMR